MGELLRLRSLHQRSQRRGEFGQRRHSRTLVRSAAGEQQSQSKTERGGKHASRPDVGHHADWGTKDPRMAMRYLYFRAACSAAWLNASVRLVGTPNAMPPLKPKPAVTG